MTMTPDGTSGNRTGAANVAFLLLALTIAVCVGTRQGWDVSRVFLLVPVFGVLQILWFRLAGREPNTVRTMLVLATIGHVAFGLFSDPLYTSDDINRYVFEGHVVSAGGNPYRFAPASPLFDDLTEARALNDVRNGVNNSAIATIYPPVAEWLFAVGTWFDAGTRGWQVITLLFDLLILLQLPTLLRSSGRDERWSIVYAFHPLVLIEGLAGSHVDVVACAFLVTAITLANRKKNAAAWVLFTFSVLTKIVCLVAGFSLLKKCGWRGAVVGALIITAAIPFCFRDGSIKPTPPIGTWSVIEGQQKGQPVRVWDEGRFLFPEDETEMLWSASGMAGLRYFSDSVRAGQSMQLVTHASLKYVEKFNWNQAFGQYHVAAFGNVWRDLDHGLVRFDGQGRIEGVEEGKYWIEDERFLVLSDKNGVAGRFRLSNDHQLISPVEETMGLHLIKYDEMVGMGFRHYSSRWTANSPIFEYVESLMPGEDIYDAKRKSTQKLLAALLVIAALVLVFTPVSLPTASLWLLFGLWITAPAIYPWYILWLVPFVAFTRCWAPLVFTYSCLFLHLQQNPWAVDQVMLAFSPVVAALVFQAVRTLLIRSRA